MPAETSGARTKPAARSSIRHSLNMTVAKAFADVINGSSKDDKTLKRRDSSRLSLKPATTPRASIDSKPPTGKSVGTPESKTITRHTRRASSAAAASSEDGFLKSTEPPLRSSSLRPRPATSSGLPKYRPKSVVIQEEGKKPPSPLRTGVRRRLSFSDDEKEDRKVQSEADMTQASAEKAARPISPLPHRAAFKVNLTSAVNANPKTAPKSNTPSPPKHSPARPNKVVKTANSASIPRPSSSSSHTSSSSAQRTPKTPSLKHGTRARNSPAPASSRLDDSPLSRLSKKPKGISNKANMSLISEAGSEDGDVEFVEKLLAPVAALGAPTPAMPRIERSRPHTATQTPTKPSASSPPDSDSPSKLRVNPSPNSSAPRGSILSFEQLANTSQTLREEDIQSILSDVQAPFQSGTSSPPLRHSVLLSVPESPCLSAMNSPGGYGSISQVLLPDVTPSPAAHPKHLRGSDVPAVDAAIVTLLRLQLSSAESLAKERLNQLQLLEEENHDLREQHRYDVAELSKQIGLLEQQVRGHLESQSEAREQEAYATSLEDQLRQAETCRDKAISNAVANALDAAETKRKSDLRGQTLKWERVNAARNAGAQWSLIHHLAENELQAVKGERETLSLLLSHLDSLESQIF